MGVVRRYAQERCAQERLRLSRVPAALKRRRQLPWHLGEANGTSTRPQPVPMADVPTSPERVSGDEDPARVDRQAMAERDLEAIRACAKHATALVVEETAASLALRVPVPVGKPIELFRAYFVGTPYAAYNLADRFRADQLRMDDIELVEREVAAALAALDARRTPTQFSFDQGASWTVRHCRGSRLLTRSLSASGGRMSVVKARTSGRGKAAL